jgi:hypothetical protein
MHKRKRLIPIVPDPEKRIVQLKYARIIALSQMASILMVILAFSFIFIKLLNVDATIPPEEAARKTKLLAFSLLGYIAIASALLSWILSLLLSHRILGPLFRIEAILKEILQKGEYIPIKIRKDDDLHGIVNILNELLSNFGKKNELPEKQSESRD